MEKKEHKWSTSSLFNVAKYLSKRFDKQYFICWHQDNYVIRQKAVGSVLWIVEPSGGIWS